MADPKDISQLASEYAFSQLDIHTIVEQCDDDIKAAKWILDLFTQLNWSITLLSTGEWHMLVICAKKATQVDDDWQDIKTAPQDGTQFLATLSNGWVVILSEIPNSKHCSWYRASCSMSVPVARTHPEGSLDECLVAICWKPMLEPGVIT